MDMNLRGKRGLVTGSSAGIGAAIAAMLAVEGAAVVVHGRDPERTEKVAQSIISSGGDADTAIGDLSNDEGADAVAAQALRNGAIDILVNNAGFYHHLDWHTATPQRWVETYEVNALSGVRMIQRLVPAMVGRGWGRVIQIGGGLASQPIPMQPDYEASLAARHNLAVSLARRLKNTGVTSNIVSPGAILVPAVKELLEKIASQHGWGETWDEIERGCVNDMVPNDVGRLGRPDEIAGAVTYLASGYADYISGATIRVDGGTVRSAF
ncbi:SDR family NAD(P)-dependent oxidoreductase [Agrobacterium tumefaciens]|uniref:SDR family NAD(P)-dependent oxidoreductase n=1 Tax=Agrobacterium tumefaciens TaxID=358 RepID=UPI0021D36EAE|nr:SDR family NAD(P)-dependent oxidoreductase [Agrobacterium tumefaciens]UXS05498.1 SDR family NAD(P)-dependent oxidoreductase [Agrobacterium tumefaciens]